MVVGFLPFFFSFFLYYTLSFATMDGCSENDSLANLSTDVSTNYATKTELANRTFTRVTVTDLNNMTTVWTYADFPYASTPSNAPYGAGTVFVYPGMSHIQIMIPYNPQSHKYIYLRVRYQSNWDAWTKIALAAV